MGRLTLSGICVSVDTMGRLTFVWDLWLSGHNGETDFCLGLICVSVDTMGRLTFVWDLWLSGHNGETDFCLGLICVSVDTMGRLTFVWDLWLSGHNGETDFCLGLICVSVVCVLLAQSLILGLIPDRSQFFPIPSISFDLFHEHPTGYLRPGQLTTSNVCTCMYIVPSS